MNAKAVFAVVVCLCLLFGPALGLAPAFADEPHALGHIPLSEEEYNARLKTRPRTRLPDELDWRGQVAQPWDYVTPAMNQGGCGSCWACACLATMEARAMIAGWPVLDLSEQHAVSCGAAHGSCCGGGAGLYGYYETTWAVQETEFPYQAGDPLGPRDCTPDWHFDGPTVPCPPPAPPFGPTNLRVVDWWTVDNNVDAMKQELYDDGPFYVGYTVYEDFDDYWDGGVPLPAYEHTYGAARGGHAVLIVGWNDDGEYWIAKNSWGQFGGPEGNGCFYIKWDNNCGFGGGAACSIEGLTVISPNGGELFHAGCEYPVTWASKNAGDYVRIRLSTDGGNSWRTLADHVLNTGSHIVRMPCEETTEARIMVVDVDDSGWWDLSDEDFEIAFPTITVDSDIDEEYEPTNPWTQDGLVIDQFEVSSDADLYNIHFVADPLQDPSVFCEPGHTKMISGDLVEFVPEVINYLEAGETVDVEIKIVVPVGQHTGVYEGLGHVLAEPGCGCSVTVSEEFDIEVKVEDVTDVDFADDRGNASRDVMLHLVGAKLDDVSGTVTVVNPDSDETNPDMADGPGNVRIERIDTIISDLVKVGDPAVAISASDITLLGFFESLASGQAAEIEVVVSIPDGIPVNATYVGTVTLRYESCRGGLEVSDTFNIMLEVLQTQGTLNIVETELAEEYCPPDDPWTAVGEVEFTFDIEANGDHRNIRISCGGLDHDTLDETIGGFSFYPEEIAFLAAGQTRTVTVVAYVPIGQHSGTYEGQFVVVSENGGEDTVDVTLEICDVYDLDIRDDYANVSDNLLWVEAIARNNQSGSEWVVRGFDIGIPDTPVGNDDEYDGPGNAPITCIEWEFDEWSPLWTVDDQGKHLHTNFLFSGEASVIGDLCDWTSGEFRRLYIGVEVPPTHGNYNRTGTYKGRLNCTALVGTDMVSEDFLDIEIQLADVVGGHAEITPVGAVGGYRVGGGVQLYWGSFEPIGLDGGVSLYREDPESGRYDRISGAPVAQDSEYLDTAVEPGTTYRYMLGIGSQGGEVLIGPLTLRGAPDFLHLKQNMPNPFREWTTIDFQLPVNSHVSVKIYDVAGRLVRTLRDREELAGYYSLTWDRTDESGRSVANGVYFYRLETPFEGKTKKMIVLR